MPLYGCTCNRNQYNVRKHINQYFNILVPKKGKLALDCEFKMFAKKKKIDKAKKLRVYQH